MSYFGKNFTEYKQENFDGFLKSVGLSDDKIQALSSYSQTSKLVKNGDTYTFSTTHLEGPKETTFKSGQEFDEIRGSNTIKMKYVIDGDTLTQTASSANGTITFKMDFSDNELVVTVTSDTWDGVAKRFYKA